MDSICHEIVIHGKNKPRAMVLYVCNYIHGIIVKTIKNILLPTIQSDSQEEIVKFYQLQVTIHHPGGALDVQHGAFAVDWDLWKVHSYAWMEGSSCTLIIIL